MSSADTCLQILADCFLASLHQLTQFQHLKKEKNKSNRTALGMSLCFINISVILYYFHKELHAFSMFLRQTITATNLLIYQNGVQKVRSSSWLHIHIRIFAYSSTCYGTPKIYKCFRFPVLLNTPDILLGILFDYTTLHRVTIIKRLTLR